MKHKHWWPKVLDFTLEQRALTSGRKKVCMPTDCEEFPDDWKRMVSLQGSWRVWVQRSYHMLLSFPMGIPSFREDR